LESHRCHEQAKKYLRPNAWGGVVSFALKGGSASADFVVDRLKLCSHLANLGLSLHFFHQLFVLVTTFME
jgi:O-acetylhomoserine/O-acetylserine sulfhydrylase